MYTYVQPGYKKVNTATYIHMGEVSNAYSRIRTARVCVNGWVSTEKLHRRVHWEATECSCSSGANQLGQRGLAYRRTEETALCSTADGRNEILFTGRGVAYRKTEETDFSSTSYGRNRVMLIGRGVAYRKMEETDLCWSATVEMGSC